MGRKSYIYELLGKTIDENCENDMLCIGDLKNILINTRVKKCDIIPLAQELERIGYIEILDNGRISGKTKIKVNRINL